MKPANAKTRFGKLKIAHATFALALLAGVGGYGWRVYSLLRRRAGEHAAAADRKARQRPNDGLFYVSPSAKINMDGLSR
jgi:hypothetical protein